MCDTISLDLSLSVCVRVFVLYTFYPHSHFVDTKTVVVISHRNNVVVVHMFYYFWQLFQTYFLFTLRIYVLYNRSDALHSQLVGSICIHSTNLFIIFAFANVIVVVANVFYSQSTIYGISIEGCFLHAILFRFIILVIWWTVMKTRIHEILIGFLVFFKHDEYNSQKQLISGNSL